MGNAPGRPVFLNLLRIRHPVTAVVSILHRISGVLMVAATPWVIYLFGLSLEGPSGYARVREILAQPAACAGLILLAWALAHHLFAGVRFLLIDIEVGVGLAHGRRSAWMVTVAGVVATVLVVGVCL